MKKFILAVVAVMAVSTLSAQNTKVSILSGSADFLQEKGVFASFEVDFSNCVVVDYGTGNKIKKDLGTLEEYLEAGNKNKDLYITPKGATNYDVATAIFNTHNKKGLQILVGANGRDSYRQLPAKKIKKMSKLGYRWEDAENVKYNIVFHVDTIDMGAATGLNAVSNMGGIVGLLGSIGEVTPGADGGARIACWGEVFDIATDDLVCEFNLGRFYGEGNPAEPTRVANTIVTAMSKQLPKLAKEGKKK